MLMNLNISFADRDYNKNKILLDLDGKADKANILGGNVGNVLNSDYFDSHKHYKKNMRSLMTKSDFVKKYNHRKNLITVKKYDLPDNIDNIEIVGKNEL